GLGAGQRDVLSGEAVERLGKGRGLLQRIEAVAGERALGKDHKLGARLRGLSYLRDDLSPIGFDVAELYIHLHACHSQHKNASPCRSPPLSLRIQLQPITSGECFNRMPPDPTSTQGLNWRRRVGIEPTRAASQRPATGLKPARTTRFHS